MSLFGMNTLWFEDITTRKICFSLLDIDLAMTLYITLHKLIGQHSTTSLVFSFFFFFGIRAVWVWLRGARLPCSLRMCKHVVVITSLTKFQCFWKNAAGRPSGPSAFVGHIWKRASLIYSFVNGLVNSSFISTVTLLSMFSNAASLWWLDGFIVVKQFAKWSHNIFSITSTSSAQFPFSSKTPHFLFFRFLVVPLAWNFFVFLSLSNN